MEVLFEILKYSLPSLFLLVLTYMMLSNFMENEEKRRSYFLRKETQKSALPVRMAAYERVALFLERIHPDRRLIRVPAKDILAHQYRMLLVDSIRVEFEHNLSQQIYLSDEAWNLVVNAKSATVGMINNWAQEVDPKAPAFELSKLILTKVMELESAFPTRGALRYLKGEIKANY
jgi:hypothetical protein